MHLFAYGTLMSGACRHHFVAARSVRPGTVRGLLLDCGDHPALIPGDQCVRGECIEIDASVLPTLDEEEGEDFERRLTDVILGDGSHCEAWVYWFTRDPSQFPQIASGDWRSHRDALSK